jgi:hypothetical protein
VPGAAEAACVADLGEQVAGDDGAYPVDRLQGDEAAVAAGEPARLALELRHLLRGRVDHRDVRVDERTHVPVEREPVEPAPSLAREQLTARAGPALLVEDRVQPLRPAGAVVAECLPQPGPVAQPLDVLGRDPRGRQHLLREQEREPARIEPVALRLALAALERARLRRLREPDVEPERGELAPDPTPAAGRLDGDRRNRALQGIAHSWSASRVAGKRASAISPLAGSSTAAWKTRLSMSIAAYSIPIGASFA